VSLELLWDGAGESLMTTTGILTAAATAIARSITGRARIVRYRWLTGGRQVNPRRGKALYLAKHVTRLGCLSQVGSRTSEE
jgi:hypothetical protein